MNQANGPISIPLSSQVNGGSRSRYAEMATWCSENPGAKRQVNGLSKCVTQCLPALLLFLIGFSSTHRVLGTQIQVAVASNFSAAAKAIATRFEQQTGHCVILVFGSTGKLYAQIIHGAPIDLFLAADERRPRLLEQKRVGVPRTRFTYAVGRLVLWSPLTDVVDSEGKILTRKTFRHLSIANPKLAPYGEAARQVLQKLGLWNQLRRRLVRGESIGQTFQFVKTGQAELGFVSLSQIRQPSEALSGSYWLPPPSLYQPIRQQAILIQDTTAARAFLQFLRGSEMGSVLREHGYFIPRTTKPDSQDAD